MRTLRDYRHVLVVVAVSLSITSLSVASSREAGEPAGGDRLSVAGLLKFENERAQAEANRDAVALKRELADDLIYVHGGGETRSKDQYLQEYVGSGPGGGIGVLGIYLLGANGKIYGNIGVTDGIIVKEVKKNMNHVARYLGIYRFEQGRWSLIRWQTTDLYRPEPPTR